MSQTETAVKGFEKTEDTNSAKEQSPALLTACIVFLLVFYAVWAVYELLIKPHIDASGISPALGKLLTDGVIKNLVWTLPAVLMIKRYDPQMRISLREMFATRPKVRDMIPMLLIFTAYTLYLVMHSKDGFTLSPDFGLPSIITVIFVGITEESVFRGWLLNAMPERIFKGEHGLWLAVGINAVLFLMIHFPIWIAKGEFVQNFTSGGFIALLILSGIFGHSFLKTRSIWAAVILHSYWDLLMFMFF